METPVARTPEQSAPARGCTITEAQKQALVNNLQLEITERARKLRTQYALQAQSLRTRLEMRINRIPQALRKRKMQDLVDEHSTKPKAAPAPQVAVMTRIPPPQLAEIVVVPSRPTPKRKSDILSAADDKENDPSEKAQELENPKKRARTAAATANTKASRTASRRGAPAAVLSPKSHNSRTQERSPVKPSLTSERVAVTTTTSRSATGSKTASRAASRQAAGGTGHSENESRHSDASNNSASTTIITKPKSSKAAAPRKATAKAASVTSVKTATTRKPTASSKAPATGRKAAVASNTASIHPSGTGTGSGRGQTLESATTSGTGRTLRKRN